VRPRRVRRFRNCIVPVHIAARETFATLAIKGRLRIILSQFAIPLSHRRQKLHHIAYHKQAYNSRINHYSYRSRWKDERQNIAVEVMSPTVDFRFSNSGGNGARSRSRAKPQASSKGLSQEHYAQKPRTPRQNLKRCILWRRRMNFRHSSSSQRRLTDPRRSCSSPTILIYQELSKSLRIVPHSTILSMDCPMV
jgi:hypothetical protein